MKVIDKPPSDKSWSFQVSWSRAGKTIPKASTGWLTPSTIIAVIIAVVIIAWIVGKAPVFEGHQTIEDGERSEQTDVKLDWTR